jgi:predicted transcriptional regulator
MSSDVDSEKLLDWIGLSKKLKLTNENIVYNLQVMLINIKFETDERMQKISEGVQTAAQTCPEPSAPQQEPKQSEAPQLTLITEQLFGSLSETQFIILKAMSEATEAYNLKTFAHQMNLKSKQIIQQLEELTKQGFLQKMGKGGYSITEKGQAFIRAHARALREVS